MISKDKKYYITIRKKIICTEDVQVYLINANNQEDAKKKALEGDFEYLAKRNDPEKVEGTEENMEIINVEEE